MFKQVIINGLGVGILAAAVLFYPLYVVLPGHYVTGWAGGQDGLAVVLTAFAVLIVAAGGSWTARTLNPDRIGRRLLIGGLTGALSGFTAFGLIGAAAAGVIAAAPTFPVATSEEAFLGSLANSVLLTIWLTHAFMWTVTLLGAMVGALGALALFPNAAENDDLDSVDTPLVFNVMLITIVLASALALVVSIAIFKVLGPNIETTAHKNDAVLWLPAMVTTALPSIDLMIMFVISHTLAAATLRKILARKSVSKSIASNAAASSALLIFLPVGLLVFIGLISPQSLLSLEFLPGILISLIVAGLIVPVARQSFALVKTGAAVEEDHPAALMQRNWQAISLGSAIGLTLPGYGIVLPIALNLVLLQVETIPYQLSESGPSAPPVAELLAPLYMMQMLSFGGIVIVTALGTVLGIGLITWIARLRRQSASQG